MSMEEALNNTRKNELGTLYQVSIMNALLQGVYDGQTTLATLAKHGDFGLGTFNSLDGELVLVDGNFYQIRSDGRASVADLHSKAPFAAVTDFTPTIAHDIKDPIDKKGLEALIGELVPSENFFYDIRLTGCFQEVRTRTVSKQQKPYRPFSQVVEEQDEFNFKDLNGILIGFFSPEYVQGVTISGYHLHFISDDRQSGGHVLDFMLSTGTIAIQLLKKYELILPEQEDFENAELSGDTAEAIKQTEG